MRDELKSRRAEAIREMSDRIRAARSMLRQCRTAAHEIEAAVLFTVHPELLVLDHELDVLYGDRL
ncbi:hypothetical protein ACIA8E_38045 [Streptomyces sp. NPDC051664]|uniref:hypothetical protein n=1 Tax=Streptomyces sp. NPDC051664 TaxID=3365668 RepID=UPI00379AA341